ncbi:hypothetical protein [Streptomyces sediminimaris]|uniref:hypothetical protein n=1 Tax=Streptomyces sediminimaris TaxID=3383721 RepID=UPI00399BF789
MVDAAGVAAVERQVSGGLLSRAAVAHRTGEQGTGIRLGVKRELAVVRLAAEIFRACGQG